MRIVLETKMEKWAWEIMMAAHSKWQKHSGSNLLNHMERYFYDIYKQETEEMIKKEAEARLAPDYGPEGLNVIGVSEEQYVQEGLDNNKGDDLLEQELEKFKQVLVVEYLNFLESYEDEKQYVIKDVKCDIWQIYYTLFSAPERLTVIYNEVIRCVKDSNNEEL